MYVYIFLVPLYHVLSITVVQVSLFPTILYFLVWTILKYIPEFLFLVTFRIFYRILFSSELDMASPDNKSHSLLRKVHLYHYCLFINVKSLIQSRSITCFFLNSAKQKFMSSAILVQDYKKQSKEQVQASRLEKSKHRINIPNESYKNRQILLCY